MDQKDYYNKKIARHREKMEFHEQKMEGGNKEYHEQRANYHRKIVDDLSNKLKKDIGPIGTPMGTI